jgi:hypothetical protein
MDSLNGFGALYYGWRHAADGTATATKWFCLSWLPVIPIGREKLRVLTDFRNEAVKPELGGLVMSQVNYYEILEKLPLSLKEILITLAKTYIGIPALLLGPAAVLVAVMMVLGKFGVKVSPGSAGFSMYILGMFLVLINFLFQVVRAIRRARGWQPNVQKISAGPVIRADSLT